jgi:hypothetical protein
MRFVTWNVRSLYRAGLLETVASELAKFNFDLVASRRSDGTGVVVSQQMIICFCMEVGMLMSWVHAFFT